MSKENYGASQFVFFPPLFFRGSIFPKIEHMVCIHRVIPFLSIEKGTPIKYPKPPLIFHLDPRCVTQKRSFSPSICVEYWKKQGLKPQPTLSLSRWRAGYLWYWERFSRFCRRPIFRKPRGGNWEAPGETFRGRFCVPGGASLWGCSRGQRICSAICFLFLPPFRNLESFILL